MNMAKTYAEWKIYAEEIDSLDGCDIWRKDDNSTYYDLKTLKKRMSDISSMIKSEDVFNLMFRLRGGLSRDQYGMQQEGLFTHASAGTKLIVSDYHECIANALNFICDHEDGEVPTDAKLAFFNETRHSYGRTALLLSGGAFLGYYHLGLVRTLAFEGLLPRVISGASAGSLMAAMFGVRTDEEMRRVLDVENAEDVKKSGIRTDFFCFGWQKKQKRALQMQFFLPQSWRWIGDALMGLIFDKQSLLKLDTEHLKTVVKENVGEFTFQEAFDRTGNRSSHFLFIRFLIFLF